jgi:tRNA A-37 threonylcarbamoyl transferase component Bud32
MLEFVKRSNNPRYEYSMHRKLYNDFPSLITRPIRLNKKFIHLQMYKNKSLKQFISRHLRSKVLVSTIVKKVKRIIQTIQAKYPLFRHNDLHIGNIIVDGKGKLRLTDFELTRLKGKTPKIIKSYGITNKHNPKYDLHCFLNSLRSFLIKLKRPVGILDKLLPPGYRGKTDKYVRNGRLTS